MHGVYKYEVDGEVVYIGKTDVDFYARVACHSKEESFAPYLERAKIFVHETSSANEADFLETLLINQYKPLLNKAKKDLTDVQVWAVLDWEPWNRVPRSFAKVKKRTHGYYLSVENIEKLERYAQEKGVTVSTLLDELLTATFKNWGK